MFVSPSPLSVSETVPAIAAMDFVRGLVTGTGAPLPEFIAAAIFFIAGPSDVAARLGPALAGIALIALLLILAAIWGSSYLFIKVGLREMSPGMVVWLVS